jgi:hypothetical protein
MWEISGLVDDLLAFRKELLSVELVSYLVLFVVGQART